MNQDVISGHIYFYKNSSLSRLSPPPPHYIPGFVRKTHYIIV